MTRTPPPRPQAPAFRTTAAALSATEFRKRAFPTSVTHISATMTLNHRFPDDRGNIPRHDARETPFSDDRGRTVRHDPHVNRCTQGTWQSPTDHFVGIPGFCQRWSFSSNPTVCHDALKNGDFRPPWQHFLPRSSQNRRDHLTVASHPATFLRKPPHRTHRGKFPATILSDHALTAHRGHSPPRSPHIPPPAHRPCAAGAPRTPVLHMLAGPAHRPSASPSTAPTCTHPSPALPPANLQTPYLHAADRPKPTYAVQVGKTAIIRHSVPKSRDTPAPIVDNKEKLSTFSAHTPQKPTKLSTLWG